MTIQRLLFQATYYFHHSNVFILTFNFIFILLLSEGRAGGAWKPSDKAMLFLPPNKSVFHFSLAFPFLIFFTLSLQMVPNFAISRSRQISRLRFSLVFRGCPVQISASAKKVCFSWYSSVPPGKCAKRLKFGREC